MRRVVATLLLALAGPYAAGVGTTRARPPTSAKQTGEYRRLAIAHARVWTATAIPAMDIMAGPADERGFPFRADVRCVYVHEKLSGLSPKFACRIGQDDVVKVKFGGTNGEVYAEVAATRLLWALGFGADRMYPVRVACDGCPRQLIEVGDTGDKSAIQGPGNQLIFDPAAIERKMPGVEFPGGAAWSWRELEVDGEGAEGGPRAQRDALKLLAVFLQHGDSKAVQQRLHCLGGWHPHADPPCAQPFMLVHDVGLTFGRANTHNSNSTGGANLSEWAQTPVWRASTGCVGNLSRSRNGTLDRPIISEAGRQFLASLLAQLTDNQIHDLFAVARMNLRLRAPDHVASGYATIDEWVDAFKQKRAEVVNRRCS